MRTKGVQATDWGLTGCGHPALGLLLCSDSQIGPARGSVGPFPSLPPSLRCPLMCPESLPASRLENILPNMSPPAHLSRHTLLPGPPCCVEAPEVPTGSHTLSPLLPRPPQGTALVPYGLRNTCLRPRQFSLLMKQARLPPSACTLPSEVFFPGSGDTTAPGVLTGPRSPPHWLGGSTALFRDFFSSFSLLPGETFLWTPSVSIPSAGLGFLICPPHLALLAPPEAKAVPKAGRATGGPC